MMSCVKGFSAVGGVLILIIGLGMLGLTIWGFLNAEYFFNNFLFLGILLGVDLLIITVSIIGICGIKKANGCMLFIFEIFVIIFVLVFAGLGAAGIILPGTIFAGNCTESNNALISIAHDSYRQANKLCSLSCPCNLTNDAIDNNGYTLAERTELRLLIRDQDGAEQYQECKSAKELNETYQSIFSVLASVQVTLQCSGWCPDEETLFYKFTNVNRGQPISTCYEQMKMNLDKYGRIIGYTCIAVAVFLMLVCLCNLCICCSEQKQGMAWRDRLGDNRHQRYS